MDVECIAVRRGIFSDSAKLLSKSHQSVVFDSLLGRRRFFIRANSPVVVKVPKRWMVEKGEIRPLGDWITSSNAWDLSWDWA